MNVNTSPLPLMGAPNVVPQDRATRLFYCRWEAAGIVTRAPRHHAFDSDRPATSPLGNNMQTWAGRWLSRWERAGGQAVVGATGVLQLDHRPPLHMLQQRQVEMAPAVANGILFELQGTVGGRRAVAALVAAARDWLDAYRDAGGSWIGTDERPQLLMTADADMPTLRRMQDDLFANATLAHAVRWQIVTERRSAHALPVADLEGC